MLKGVRQVSAAMMLLGWALHANAMDRFEALGLIESGNNDHATGPHGEISRFQMQPEIWKRYAPTNADWTNPQDSLGVAKAIMLERCAAFEKASNRPPTDFEFYVLWNAPTQMEHPSKAVSKRAERFSNLVNLKPPPEPPKPQPPTPPPPV